LNNLKGLNLKIKLNIIDSMKEKTCRECNGKCCRYVTTELDTPKTQRDFEDIKWFVAHKNVTVFVEKDGQWYVEFITPCKNLGDDNRCKIYEKRPEICRELTHDECEFHNGYTELFQFKEIKDVEEYMKKFFNKEKTSKKTNKK
jgi:uncharacterized protein